MSRRRGPATPLMVAGAVAVLTVALRLHDPHQHGSWGLCPLRAVTGLDCPGCGGLRAVNDLGHGDLAAAASSNLFFVASIPLLVVLWAAWLWRSRRPDAAQRPLPRGRARALVSVYLGLLVVFTILRNTPWGHSLYV
ncbi:MAG: DUF2752 domain-containing protein [Marmoricola sp.]